MPEKMATEDLELLRRWCAGDRLAGTQLFRRHFPAVQRFFRNKVQRVADCEDLIQSTFMACAEHPERFSGRSSFRTYLFGIAHHKLLNYFRARRRSERRFEVGSVTAAELGPSPASAVAQREEQRVILEALRNLPLELQVILELYYWESMPARQIAESLDLPMGTIRSRIRRAKRELGQWLARHSALPQLLESTVHDLDDWACELRDSLGKELPG